MKNSSDKKVKVLQINKLYYPERGGIEKVMQQIAEGLKDKVEMEVLVCRKKGRGTRETISGVPVYRAGSLGVVSSVPISFPFIWKVRRMSKGKDILHAHMPFPLGDLACLLSGYKGKLVISWHSDVVRQKKMMRLYRPLMEAFLKRADVILVSAGGIIKGSKYLGPYEDKCRVVPFAVDNEVLRQGGRYLEKNGYDRHNECLNILFVGRLVYYKGISVLLEAIEKVAGKVKLTVIGAGALEEELKKACRENGMEDRVEFLGKVSDQKLRQCYEKTDLFVLPSTERSETFGLVQLEAMAYGIPVINTNLKSGVPEVSLHKKTGLTVEPGSASQLAAAIRWILAHPQQRLELGMQARKRVEENFTEEVMMNRVLGIYKELLAR